MGFLSLISQDSRTEFFMAAFTLKLVAKTKVHRKKKNKRNKQTKKDYDFDSMFSFYLSAEPNIMALPVYYSLVQVSS